MRSFWYSLIFTFGLVSPACAQWLQEADSLQPDEPFENIHVKALQHTEQASLYVIWVKKEVKPHRHNHHTEHVYILEGEGEMLMQDSVYHIRAGMVLVLPPGTIHAVRTTSEVPLKVLSIQSPRFFGKDREFVDVSTW